MSPIIKAKLSTKSVASQPGKQYWLQSCSERTQKLDTLYRLERQLAVQRMPKISDDISTLNCSFYMHPTLTYPLSSLLTRLLMSTILQIMRMFSALPALLLKANAFSHVIC